ncbi:MAG: TonB-dependent receptor, partial [Thermodesulfovibrionales bacterium]
SNAVFAVVNIITRRGRDVKTLEASGEAGSFNTYKGRLTYGNSFQNGLEAVISGSLYDSKGPRHLFFQEFDSPDTNHGITDHTDYDRFHSSFAKLSYHDFTVEGAYVSRTKGIPTASFGIDFNDPRNKTVDWTGYLDLKYERSLTSKLAVMGRIFYEYYGYSGDYIYGGVANKDLTRGDWWRGELKVMSGLLDEHKIIVGAEYQANIRQVQKNYDEDPYFLYLDDKRHSSISALYIQDEFTLHKKLILDAGVRYDHYSTFGSTTNPRLALIYNPFEKTFFKLLYGRAFRAPNVFELYYHTALGPTKGNPDLKPEKISTYELVYEQYIGTYLRATATGFYYKINDLITQTTDPADNALVYKNLGKVSAKGIELEIEAKSPSGYEGRISYSFHKAEDATTGEILSNSARHLAKLNITVPFVREKVFLGIEEQYTSRRKTLSGNDAKSFYVTNVTIFSRNLLKNLEASVSMYNLFDCRYGDPGAEEHLQDTIRQDGRTFRLKLTYRF